jgi:hypothetical protein
MMKPQQFVLLRAAYKTDTTQQYCYNNNILHFVDISVLLGRNIDMSFSSELRCRYTP